VTNVHLCSARKHIRHDTTARERANMPPCLTDEREQQQQQQQHFSR
jgi:hypothetical protein